MRNGWKENFWFASVEKLIRPISFSARLSLSCTLRHIIYTLVAVDGVENVKILTDPIIFYMHFFLNASKVMKLKFNYISIKLYDVKHFTLSRIFYKNFVRKFSFAPTRTNTWGARIIRKVSENSRSFVFVKCLQIFYMQPLMSGNFRVSWYLCF